MFLSLFFFFFNDTATTEIYTLSLHDALPISRHRAPASGPCSRRWGCSRRQRRDDERSEEHTSELQSHVNIVCRLLLEKKKEETTQLSDDHRQSSRDVRLVVRCEEQNQKPRYEDQVVFFFNDTATTEIYTLSLHDALPIPVATTEAVKKTPGVVAVSDVRAGEALAY